MLEEGQLLGLMWGEMGGVLVETLGGVLLAAHLSRPLPPLSWVLPPPLGPGWWGAPLRPLPVPT